MLEDLRVLCNHGTSERRGEGTPLDRKLPSIDVQEAGGSLFSCLSSSISAKSAAVVLRKERTSELGMYTGLHSHVRVTHRSTHGHTHTYTNKEQAKSHTGRRKGNLKHAHSECSTFLSFTQLSFQRLAVKQSRQQNATGHNWSKKKF